ncbi:ATP-binding protein [Thalassoglobus sp. JC818]|uniref:ATP-binding response regulator n=1 Tax=Thalassoglobus sp. JC818 TaxID=3232136 RepID=UPI003458EA92
MSLKTAFQTADLTGGGHDAGSRFVEHMRRYSIALFSTLTATWIRMELDPILESKVPFGLFFVSSLLTAWLAGTGPAILAAVLSLLSAAHFIIPPHDSLLLIHASDLVSLWIYLGVTIAAIMIFNQLSVQRRISENSAKENARLNDGLMEADRRKDEFLAMLAHELRNPLTPIQTALDILEDGPKSRQQSHALHTIRRQLGQTIRLVNDLLDASRYVHGKLRVQLAPINLVDAVEMAIEMSSSVIQERGHQFRASLPTTPVMINGDLARMSQSISNLLHNAAKFTPVKGHIRLAVSSENGFASVCVEDDGIGIPQELESDIFELFRQVNSSRSRREGGLGIGLSLVRHIIAAHQGTVEMVSDGLGQGTRFVLRIPCLKQEKSETAPHSKDHTLSGGSDSLATSHKALSKPEFKSSQEAPRRKLSKTSNSTRVASSNRRILIVDDNVDSAEMLKLLLSMEGYDVITANNGIDGIQLAEVNIPDVILLDIGLPGMDGFEVARILRRQPEMNDVRIIAVSGWDGNEYRDLSREVGIDHHVAKPFLPNDLIKLIEAPSSEKSGKAVTLNE